MFELKFAMHRAEVSVLTGSRCPCFGIWTPVLTLPALAEESDPSISRLVNPFLDGY